jgi:hypothetical protein
LYISKGRIEKEEIAEETLHTYRNGLLIK